ncbi:MAG: hypothetical protein LKE33_08010 [Acidaminococcus sp.]|jgi:hypothetical protein|nr:hypothetical protein [Acidaminococcus sp.]
MWSVSFGAKRVGKAVALWKGTCLSLVLGWPRTHFEAELFIGTFQLFSEESRRMDFVELVCDHSTYLFLYDFLASAQFFASLHLSCFRVHQKQVKKRCKE